MGRDAGGAPSTWRRAPRRPCRRRRWRWTGERTVDFLLNRRGFPVDVVYGEADMPWPQGEDWGYGPPRILTADRVHAAAEALEDHTPDALAGGVTPTDLAAANIYPTTIWERGEETMTDGTRHKLLWLSSEPARRVLADRLLPVLGSRLIR
ncbi:DUF1877 family protein [Streptomyces vinaceus]|uniref:DUF1877 family protein n=1 Tax=Streptomyces vinaceus TaxID=1960 RepID=UPI0035E251EC